jgi:hypothetical protein
VPTFSEAEELGAMNSKKNEWIERRQSTTRRRDEVRRDRDEGEEMKEELLMLSGKDDGDERFEKWKKRRILE